MNTNKMKASLLTKTKSYCLEVKIADSKIEISECQSLITNIYYETFGTTLSNGNFNTKEKIEIYPHYYLMGIIDDELVATMGLYLYNINSQQYTYVTEEEIKSALNKKRLSETISPKNKRELNKFVVKKEWRNTGVGQAFLGLSHSKDFIHLIGDDSHILVNTAKPSMFKILDYLGIKSQTIKSISANKINSDYSSDESIETRLTVPCFDIPPCWYNFKLPGIYKVDI